MLWLLVLLPLLVVAAVVIRLAMQSGEVRAERALTIPAEPQRGFEAVRRLQGWRDWSPWLLHEPDARLEYAESPEREGGHLPCSARPSRGSGLHRGPSPAARIGTLPPRAQSAGAGPTS